MSKVIVLVLSVVVAMVGLLAMPRTAVAAIPGTGIAGRVVDAEGNPVADAIVILKNADGDTIARTMSGDRGQFGFRDVRPGGYQVHAGKDGVGRGVARTLVRRGHVSRVRIELTQ